MSARHIVGTVGSQVEHFTLIDNRAPACFCRSYLFLLPSNSQSSHDFRRRATERFSVVVIKCSVLGSSCRTTRSNSRSACADLEVVDELCVIRPMVGKVSITTVPSCSHSQAPVRSPGPVWALGRSTDCAARTKTYLDSQPSNPHFLTAATRTGTRRFY